MSSPVYDIELGEACSPEEMRRRIDDAHRQNPSPAEAALRKLLADVQEGRDWWMTHVGDRGQKPWAAMLSTGEQDYLERLAREGLGEP